MSNEFLPTDASVAQTSSEHAITSTLVDDSAPAENWWETPKSEYRKPLPHPFAGNDDGGGYATSLDELLGRSAVHRADTGEAVAPNIPGGHKSREMKVELGDGPITGGFTLTVETGKTGVVSGDKWKALESTAATNLKNLSSKIELSALSGELDDVAEFAGFKLAIEVNVATVSKEGKETDFDLGSITVKIVGDAKRIFQQQLPEGMTASLDGRITFAVGGKLAAKLAEVAAAKAAQRALTEQADDAARQLRTQAKKIKGLKESLESPGVKANYGTRGLLENKLGEANKEAKTIAKRLRGITDKLGAAKDKLAQAVGRVQGKLAKQLAKTMERQAMKKLRSVLLKALPILNWVSTIIDIVDLLINIAALIDGADGDGSGDDTEESSGEASDEGAASEESAISSAVDEPSSEEATSTDEVAYGPQQQTKKPDANPAKLSPNAEKVLESLKRHGRGTSLEEHHRQMLDTMIPEDLTAEEVRELLAILRSPGAVAGNPEDVLAAVDQAVRRVRDKGQVVTVNGVARTYDIDGNEMKTDAAQNANEPKRSSGEDGPVTSPSQLAEPVTLKEIVQNGDPAIVATWFDHDGDVLVWGARGRAWVAENVGAEIEPGMKLKSVEHVVLDRNDGGWDVTVTFGFGAKNEIPHHYNVQVGGSDNGFGAKVGALKVVKYGMAE
jgi:hypothetical protein